MAKSGAVTLACSQSRRVPTGTRKRLANSDCDRPRPVLVLRIRRARWPRSSASAVTPKSSASAGSAGSVIRSFFTLVAPSHRDHGKPGAIACDGFHPLRPFGPPPPQMWRKAATAAYFPHLQGEGAERSEAGGGAGNPYAIALAESQRRSS